MTRLFTVLILVTTFATLTLAQVQVPPSIIQLQGMTYCTEQYQQYVSGLGVIIQGQAQQIEELKKQLESKKKKKQEKKDQTPNPAPESQPKDNNAQEPRDK